MRTKLYYCAHCAKELTMLHNPDRPDDVTVYCSWRCRVLGVKR